MSSETVAAPGGAFSATRGRLQPGQAGYTRQVVDDLLKELELYCTFDSIFIDRVALVPLELDLGTAQELHKTLSFRTDAEIAALQLPADEPAFATLLRIAHITSLEISDMRFTVTPISERASVQLMEALAVSGVEKLLLFSVSMASGAWQVLGDALAKSAVQVLSVSGDTTSQVFLTAIASPVLLARLAELYITDDALRHDSPALPALVAALETLAEGKPDLGVTVDLRRNNLGYAAVQRLDNAGVFVDAAEPVPAAVHELIMSVCALVTYVNLQDTLDEAEQNALTRLATDSALIDRVTHDTELHFAIRKILATAITDAVVTVVRAAAKPAKRAAEDEPESERSPKRRA